MVLFGGVGYDIGESVFEASFFGEDGVEGSVVDFFAMVAEPRDVDSFGGGERVLEGDCVVL